jgi:hypothetical protein
MSADSTTNGFGEATLLLADLWIQVQASEKPVACQPKHCPAHCGSLSSHLWDAAALAELGLRAILQEQERPLLLARAWLAQQIYGCPSLAKVAPPAAAEVKKANLKLPAHRDYH